ncbi:recombinase RecX [Weissella coleopterorum]|uniref:Regulatory protein RecX n=1 Tax=Weissella coleopterorum TaxID=2714949 RepID=A0A6G8B189_9LACO|nr:RecX family transcriptional regulator [Weissella coleopterorum]QIL51000.1 recombinase RecX [Weissella coleopterorum]
MTEVTRVTRTKKGDRYNIYLDHEFAFAVAEKILIQFNLFKGTQVEPELRTKIIAAEYNQKAYQKALTYAAGSLHSKQQVRTKLLQADFPAPVIDQAVARLEELGIIDDVQFANEYLAGQIRRGKLGPRSVKFNLQKYGIDQFVIEDLLVQYDETTENENLAQLIEPLFQKYRRESTFMADQKVSQKLYQNGFDQRAIKNAIQSFHATTPVDMEQLQENFERTIERVTQKYQAFTGWEYQSKVKAGMYRRGFDLRQVDQWLKSHRHD